MRGGDDGNEALTKKNFEDLLSAFSSTSVIWGRDDDVMSEDKAPRPAISRMNLKSASGLSASGRDNMVQLASNIKDEMLRAVKAHHALRLFGTHLGSGSLADHGTDESIYSFSEEVSSIDDFISHDWATPRFPKFLSMCMVYNAHAAILGSLIVGCIATALQADSIGLLPKPVASVRVFVGTKSYAVRPGIWCTILCPFSFLVFLFFWQRLRHLFRWRPKLLFVDKFCVNQQDEAMKIAAVYSLAGFLRHSRRLVILYSPKYFSRLWCTFEVATWIHLRRDIRKSVLFLPVMLAPLVLMLVFILWGYHVLLLLTLFAPDYWWPIFLAILICTGLVLIYAFHHVRQDANMMRAQIGSFSIDEAECFCCTNDHLHPETGEKLRCDRELVYAMLERWFSPADSLKELDTEFDMSWLRVVPMSPSTVPPAAKSPKARQAKCRHHLRAFDDLVHTRFTSAILYAMRDVPYRIVLFVGLPSCWFSLDTVDSLQVMEFEPAFRYVSFHFILAMALNPLSYAVYLRVLVYLDAMMQTRASKLLDWCVSAMAFVIWVACYSALQMLLRHTRMNFASWEPQLVLSAAYLLMTGVVFRNFLNFPAILSSAFGLASGSRQGDEAWNSERSEEDKRKNDSKTLQQLVVQCPQGPQDQTGPPSVETVETTSPSCTRLEDIRCKVSLYDFDLKPGVTLYEL